MASKQNIKETISLLCKIIHKHKGTKITAETFRLAKFDKNEATMPMWKLLFETNNFLNNGSFNCDEESTKDCKNLVLCTKHELFVKGYYVKDFFSLPEDMSCGSREILLAFGWIMGKTKFLKILLENTSNLLEECVPIDTDIFSKPNSNGEDSWKCGDNSRNLTAHTDNLYELPELDQLSWILGKLKLSCHGLYSSEDYLISLVNKIHCATLGADNPKRHLSTLEVFLLRHPKELEKFQEKLDQYNLYLVNLLNFIEKQDVFWKWMNSVLEAKLTERKKTGGEGFKCNMDKSCSACQGNLTKEVKKVSLVQLELQKALHDGNSLYCKASEVILKNNISCGELDERCYSELNDKMNSLELEETSVVCKNKYQMFSEFKQLQATASVTGNVRQPSSCAQEIFMLKEEISKLEVELTELRKLHFEILNDLAADSQEFVCIPPIGTSKYIEVKNK